MFAINAVQLTKLATALINGDENFVEKLIERKLEGLGEKLIMDLVGGPLGTTYRIQQAISTAGASEFDRLRRQWLASVTPSPVPGTKLIDRLTNAFNKNVHELSRPEGKYWKWSKSRDEWLNEGWRHDWRTQPRDYHGRWIPGRLRHPYVPKQVRRMRSARRRLAKKMARQMMTEWSRGH